MRWLDLDVIRAALLGSACLAAVALVPAALAQDRRPLPVEEGSTLHQRVLVRPDATVLEAPAGAAIAAQPRSFSALYVFAREDGHLEVGPAANPPTLGWLPADEAIDWSQTIVVTFSNPAGRERSLLFGEASDIEALFAAEDLVTQLAALREQAVAKALPDDSPVVSIEAAEHVDLREEFYILPILDHTSVFDPNTYEELLLLQVASVPESFEPTAPGPSRDEILKEFDVGVLFVIDTTRSMGPYIDATRDAVLRIAERIQGSDVGERVGFGLIGFRDDATAVAELEYTTRTFLKMRKGQSPAEIERALEGVSEAEASSIGFNEDVYAAVADAVGNAGWAGFDGRYVIVISDAGPKLARDSTIDDRADVELLSADAREAGIAIYTLHLRTAAGASTHGHAEGEYRRLSRGLGSDQTDRYFPIERGDPEVFRGLVDDFVEQLTTDISAAVDGELADAQDEAGSQGKASLDTYAMQLALLGRLQRAQAPDVFEAWLSDRALEDLTKTAVEVRLLITKNQLNTLREVLQAIVDAAEGTRGQTDSTEFFERVRSAVASMARDPSRLVDAQFETLGGAMGDFLDGLPYRSELLEMSSSRWANLSSIEQRDVIDRLRRKMRAFERLHDDEGRWQSLNEGTPDGERVYAMPLDYLP